MPFPPGTEEKVRQRLEAGALPRSMASKMFAGPGSERACDACDQHIAANQIEYEFDAPDGRVVRFHLGCAGVWEAERRKRGWL